MINILFIVGLPGSGKTYLANKINMDNNNKYHIIDDPKNFDTDIKPFLNQDVIITDPNLCFENDRIKAINKIKRFNEQVKIDWIFFENDPKSCLINSELRNRNSTEFRKVDLFIKNFSRFYTIPENSNIVEVYKRKKSSK